MQISDKQLIINIRHDDYYSYNQLFGRYYGRLCLFVNGILGSKTDAEDIVQEVFIKLWTNRKQYLITENVSSYLYQMARNTTLNYIRGELSRKAATDKLQEAEIYFNAHNNVNEEGEFSIELEDCIERLPQRSKEVIRMHHLEGYKHKEIAESRNISIKTIKNQIWQSLKRLKECLELKNFKPA